MATPKDLPRDVGGFIRDLRRNARISLRQLAEQAGVSNPYLSQVERGLRKPSAEVLQQLASALRVSTPVMYLRAGLLDDKDGPGVLAAIATDSGLTMAQKQSLSQIYETFRRENARVAEPGPDTAEPGPDTVEPGPDTAAAEPVLRSVAVTETDAAPAPGFAPAGPGAERTGRATKKTKNRPEAAATGPTSGTAQPDPAASTAQKETS